MAADSPTPTTLILLLPPSPPPSLDPSPIQYILALLALVSIPILFYLFLFAIRRPSLPATIDSSLSSPSSSAIIQIKSSFTAAAAGGKTVSDDTKCCDVETEGEDVDDHACVVCLSGFDGREATKQLSMCKHAFHASCIDAWLDSNGNTCPICRASIGHQKGLSKEPQPGPSEMV